MPGNESESIPEGTLVKIADGDFRNVGRVVHPYSCWPNCCRLDNGHTGVVVETYDTPFPENRADLMERRKLLLSLLQRACNKSYDLWCEATSEKLERTKREYETLAKFYRLVNHGSTPSNKWFWEWVALSADNPRHFSYSWEERWVDTDARRRHSSVSSFLKTAVRKGLCELTEEEIRLLSNLIGQYFPDTLKYSFRVVSGNAVCSAYAEGISFGSCMTVHAQDFVRWYSENPEKASLVRIEQGGTYVGRALLWDTDQGVKLLDRVYPSDGGPHVGAVERYAEEQGWDYRTHHSCGALVSHSGREDYTVTMKRPSLGYYPYMDSFAYTNDDPDGAAMIELNCKGGDYEFHNTGGSWDGGSSRETCEACGDLVDEEDASYNEDGYAYCEACYNERYVCLDYRRPGGRYVSVEARRDDVTGCDECNEDRLPSDVYNVQDRNICCCCAEECITICQECDEEILTENAVDGYCPDCVPSDDEEESEEEETNDTTDEAGDREGTENGNDKPEETAEETPEDRDEVVDAVYPDLASAPWELLFWRPAFTEGNILDPLRLDMPSRVRDEVLR